MPSQLVERVDVARPQVEEGQHGARDRPGVGVGRAQRPAHRIDEGVDDDAGHVARVGRAEQGQHDVPAFLEAPRPHGLAGIFVMVGDIEQPIGDVDEPAHPEGGVGQEAQQALARTIELALEQIVQQDQRRACVAQYVADGVAQRLRHADPVPTGDRPEHQLIDRVVQLEHVAVVVFPRIVGLFPGEALLGVFGRNG